MLKKISLSMMLGLLSSISLSPSFAGHMSGVELNMTKGEAIQALSQYTRKDIKDLNIQKIIDNPFHTNTYSFFNPGYHYTLLAKLSEDSERVVRLQMTKYNPCVYLNAKSRGFYDQSAYYIPQKHMFFSVSDVPFIDLKDKLTPYIEEHIGNKVCFNFFRASPDQLYNQFGLSFDTFAPEILVLPEYYEYKKNRHFDSTIYSEGIDLKVDDQIIYGMSLNMAMDEAIAAVLKDQELHPQSVKKGYLDQNAITGRAESKFFEVSLEKAQQKIRVDLSPNPDLHPSQLFVSKITLENVLLDDMFEQFGVPYKTVKKNIGQSDEMIQMSWCKDECDEESDSVLTAVPNKQGKHNLVLFNNKYQSLSHSPSNFQKMPDQLMEYIKKYQYQSVATENFDIGGVKIGMTLDEAVKMATEYYPDPFVRIEHSKQYNSVTDNKENMTVYITLKYRDYKRQLLTLYAVPDVMNDSEQIRVYKVTLQDDFRENYFDGLDKKYGPPTRAINHDAIWCQSPDINEFYPCEKVKTTRLHHWYKKRDYLILENTEMEQAYEEYSKRRKYERDEAAKLQRKESNSVF